MPIQWNDPNPSWSKLPGIQVALLLTGFVILTLTVLIAVCPVYAAAPSDLPSETANYLHAIRDTGRPLPSDADFERWLEPRAANSSYAQVSKAWNVWMSAQRPPIALADLKALIAAQIQSIHSAFVQYELIRSSLQPDAAMLVTSHVNNQWWMVGNKLRRDVLDKTGVPTATHTAYDGKAEYSLNLPYGMRRYGGISQFQARYVYFDQSSPWVLAMLDNSKSDLGRPLVPYDLVQFLDPTSAIVEESADVLDGHKTVVVMYGVPAAFKVWLDPAANYAVAQFAQTTYAATSGLPLFTNGYSYLRKCHGLKDRGDGIYLPDETVEEFYAGPEDAGLTVGALQTRNTVRVTQATVNGNIGDSVFTNIFPKGTVVNDNRIGSRFVFDESANVATVPDHGLDQAKAERESEPSAGQSPVADVPNAYNWDTGAWLTAIVGLLGGGIYVALRRLFRRSQLPK